MDLWTNIRYLLLTFLICLTASLLNQCQKEKSTYTVESANGHRIIYNREPLWKDNQKITLGLIKKIGGIEPEKEEYIFYKNFDMVQDSRGHKFVLSWGEYLVRKFDKDWNFVLDFGGVGQGPGEIEWPMCLAIDSIDNIYIIEFRRGGRAVKYSPDGVYLKDIKLPGNCRKMIILNSGDYVLDALDLSQEVNPTLMAVVSPEGEIIKKFCSAEKYEDSPLTHNANQVFFTRDRRDNIYIAFENQNRIEKYSSAGDLIWRMKQSLGYPIINKMDKEMWPDLTYVHTDIKIDSKGRLWVTTFKSKPEDTGTRAATLKDLPILEFRIYSKDGIWLERIAVPVSHFKKRIYGNRLYLIDPYYEACVYEYEIVE